MATDLIDQLIYQALQDEVKGTEPSPQVWDSICERIASTDVTCQGRDARAWVPLLRIGAQAMLGVLSGDDDWEARLAKHRVPVSWLLPFAGALVWAV